MASSTTAEDHLSRWLFRVTTVVWVGLSVAWLKADVLIRDGDEEGHVGAAELIVGDLRSGDWMGYIERLWMGPMGEYPQAFTAGVGAWWWAWGVGLPSDTTIRMVCLFSLLTTALATARIARRYVPTEQAESGEFIAYFSVLLLPLGNGLTRHFMPEGALMAAVAVSLLLAHRLVERPSIGRAGLLGLSLGLGLLTKQTFPILIVLPLLWVLRRLGRRATSMLLVALSVALVTAGPWWLANASSQLDYGITSMANRSAGGVWAHLLYYPRILVFIGLGPALTLAGAWAAFKLWRASDQRGWIFGLIWLMGGVLLLTLIPKKYPRIAAPLTPAVAIWIAVLWTQSTGRKLALKAFGLGAIVSLSWASLRPGTLLQPINPVDLGCPQVWLRSPSAHDLGLAAALDDLSGRPPGDVLVEDDYTIPCDIQTTHSWSNHLAPYLRRAGHDRSVHTDPAQPHRFVIRVGSLEGAALDGEAPIRLEIRDRLSP